MCTSPSLCICVHDNTKNKKRVLFGEREGIVFFTLFQSWLSDAFFPKFPRNVLSMKIVILLSI